MFEGIMFGKLKSKFIEKIFMKFMKKYGLDCLLKLNHFSMKFEGNKVELIIDGSITMNEKDFEDMVIDWIN